MDKDLTLVEVDKNLPQALAEIWPVVEQAKKEMGFSQTTTEMQLGNLQYSGETPIAWISQCYAQSSNKAAALREAYYNLKKNQLKLEELYEKNDSKSLLKAEKIESDIKYSEHYIQTCYQDLMTYINTADKIREKWNIPEQVSKEELAENSKREHIRKAMRQALRDIENGGVISKGVSEHLEQYGIHPMTARLQVEQYRKSVIELFEQNKVPTLEHMLRWLDAMEELHYPGVNAQMTHMKLID